MNVFIVGILKIVLLEALAGLLIASYFFERQGSRRVRRTFSIAFATVALLAGFGYFNFGSFHFGAPAPLVHVHEQFHFYFGSAYLEELRYDGIYLATALAAEEDGTEIDDWHLRDPMTFKWRLAKHLRVPAHQVRARFDEDRWEAFKADRRFFFDELHLSRSALDDHGNTGSPAWAAVAYPLTRLVGTGRTAANLYALLDPLLLLVLFVAMRRSFGPRAACIAIVIGLMPPRVYDFLGGSLLRLDWLFALGMSAVCFKRGRHKTAGAFLGYAIASKIFCGLIALALGIRLLVETVRSRRLQREHVALVGSSIVTLATGVAFSSMIWGFGIWGDFFQRLLMTYRQQYYAINHSLRDLFLQVAYAGTAVLDWTPPVIAADLERFDIDDYTFSFLVLRLAFLAAFGFVLARHETVFAYGIGVLFVFVVLVTNMYYWQMLLLLALVCASRYREDWRLLLYLVSLCAFLMAEHAFIHFHALEDWRGYFGSYLLALLCVLILAAELSSTDRARALAAKLLGKRRTRAT